MLRSRWTHLIILALDSLAFGIILDLTLPNPIYAFMGTALFVVVGVFWMGRASRLTEKIGFSIEDSRILRTLLLALIFFSECVCVGWLLSYT